MIDDDIDGAPVVCSMCGGPGLLMGTLGKMQWYECRDCGMQFHVLSSEEENDGWYEQHIVLATYGADEKSLTLILKFDDKHGWEAEQAAIEVAEDYIPDNIFAADLDDWEYKVTLQPRRSDGITLVRVQARIQEEGSGD